MCGNYITYTAGVLTGSSLQTNIDTLANRVDADEMAHNKWPHQNLHCMHLLSIWAETLPLFVTTNVPKVRDERVYFRNSGLKGLMQWSYLHQSKLHM